METILDYNPTDKELKRFGGRKTVELTIDKGLYEIADNRLYDLGLLFAGRGNKKKADEYFSQIEHKEMLATLVEDF